jgi:hypothetical protein
MSDYAVMLQVKKSGHKQMLGIDNDGFTSMLFFNSYWRDLPILTWPTEELAIQAAKRYIFPEALKLSYLYIVKYYPAGSNRDEGWYAEIELTHGALRKNQGKYTVANTLLEIVERPAWRMRLRDKISGKVLSTRADHDNDELVNIYWKRGKKVAHRAYVKYLNSK